MNILATQYTLATKSLEIYISGCKADPHCEGCHNPESWNFGVGVPVDCKFLCKLAEKLRDFESLIKNVMIFGGEPLDQDHKQLENLLGYIKAYELPIWLFTRYSIFEVPDFVKNTCDYIKCGRYVHELECEDNIQYGIKLATSNQKIYKKGVDY